MSAAVTTPTTGPIRLKCLVPGCRRTRGQRKGEAPISGDERWICADHWRLIPAYMRRRYRKIIRRYERAFGSAAFWTFPGGSPARLAALRLVRMQGKAFDLCTRKAIEKAAGL